MEDGASEAEWDMVAVLDGDAPTVTTAGMDQAAALAAARTEAEAEATGTASCTEAAAKPSRAISIVSCMLMLAAASLLVKMIFAVVHTVDETEIKPPPPLLAPPVHEHDRFRCDWFALFVFIGILEALILFLDFATLSPAIVEERPVPPLPSSPPRVSPLDLAATLPHATRRPSRSRRSPLPPRRLSLPYHHRSLQPRRRRPRPTRHPTPDATSTPARRRT